MRTIIIVLLTIVSSHVYALEIYSEFISGNLSGLINAPTPIGELTSGENSIVGRINEGGDFNADVFTFSVAPTHTLTSLKFTLNSDNENHFLAMSNEATLDADVDFLLFASLVSNAQNGNNLLISESDGGNQSGTGYTLPLPSGDYSLWFQETSNNTVDYTFTLTTTPIPEVANFTLLISILWCAAAVVFRRNKRH